MAEYTGTFERKEVKYRLNPVQVRTIKQALGAYMAPDEYGQTSITSVYYDTRNRDMISRSLEKPAYKEKLRLRTYGPRSAQAPVFVELKKKHKGIVYKRRIAVSESAAQLLMVGVPYGRAIGRHPLVDEALETESHSAKSLQIAEEVAACVRRNGPVFPSMAILVERVAWAPLPDARGAQAEGVRITFDERIRYRDLFALEGKRASVPLLAAGEAIMEVKVPGACPLWLVRVLDDCKAYPTSFSKYGEAYLACEGKSAPKVYREQVAFDEAMRGERGRSQDGQSINPDSCLYTAEAAAAHSNSLRLPNIVIGA